MSTTAEILALALQHRQAGRLLEAERLYLQLLETDPGCAEAHFQLGMTLKKSGRAGEAMIHLKEAARLQPEHVDAWLHLAALLTKAEMHQESLEAMRQVAQLAPGSVKARGNLGITLLNTGRAEEALPEFREALRLQPDSLEMRNYLAMALLNCGRLQETLEETHAIMSRHPDSIDALNFRSIALLETGQYDEALRGFEDILCRNPELASGHFHRAWIRLLRGDYERGLPEFEWRFRHFRRLLPKLEQPMWDGGPLKGRTVLLYAEQGVGDALQFIRYAPLVKRLGGSVICECPEKAGRILSTCGGIDAVIERGQPRLPYDTFIPLMSLPRVFGTGIDTIPREIPYLQADKILREEWRDRLKLFPEFKVGIAWRGNPRNAKDRLRSTSLSQWTPIAGIPGATLISLQKDDDARAVNDESNCLPVSEIGAREWNDFMDTAAVISNLDLVISVDTAVAHLAGALGVEVWLALPYVPDWRWLLDRDDSPWYPTMRLFRQNKLGDWEDTFARIAAALRQRHGEPGA